MSIKIILCYLTFYLEQLLGGEEHQYTKSYFLFVLKKSQALKTKTIININYLTIVPIKIRLLFLVFNQYGLDCKYGIISQLSI